jgi:uncharacterized repeat protein (TIGR03803 family)
LTLSGNTLYGTTFVGGRAGNGTVFAVDTNGVGFANLYSFTATPPFYLPFTNSDGANPYGGLILSGNTLYGTTSAGGTSGNGTVFALSLIPPLEIIAYGNQVVLSWPAWAPGFHLQYATNLAAPAWTSLFAVPIDVNGRNTITNVVPAAPMLYRLSR